MTDEVEVELLKALLGRYLYISYALAPRPTICGWDDLAKKATLLKMEIFHPGDDLTAVKTSRQTVYFDGEFGKPGKALAIILPLPEQKK